MRRLLQISLLLNLLLSLLIWARSKPNAPSVAPTTSVKANAGQAAKASFRRLTRSGAAPSRSATPWSAVQAVDPARFAENLRAIGCPEQTIRDILVLQISRSYRNKLLEAQAEAARKWDYTRNRTDWKELSHRQGELRNEMISTLESVLGQDWNSLTTAVRGWPERGGDGLQFLTADKRRELRELDQRYSQLTEDLEAKKAAGRLDAEGSTRLRGLERQKRMELAVILSPSEFAEYLYRRSPSADYVRQNLRAGSESEFRTMVKVAREVGLFNEPASSAFARRYGLVQEPDADANDFAQRKAAFDQRLKAVLGEQRIAEQQAEELARAEEQRKQEEEESKERARVKVSELAAQIGISAEAAQKFFDRIEALEPVLKPKFEALEKSLTGTPEEKKKKMDTALKAELGPLAQEIMGEKGSALLDRLAKAGF